MIYILLVLVVVKEGPKIDIYLVNSNRQNVALQESSLIIIIYQKKVIGEIIKEREREITLKPLITRWKLISLRIIYNIELFDCGCGTK